MTQQTPTNNNIDPKKTAALAPKRDNEYGSVEMVDLREDFEQIQGFLVQPSEKDPRATSFAAILVNAVPFTTQRGQKSHWFVMRSVADQKCEYEDNESGRHIVKKGDVIGVSEKGAIKGLVQKIGHLCVLSWTGKKVQIKDGNMMWECNVKVSKDPVERQETMKVSDIPFD